MAFNKDKSKTSYGGPTKARSSTTLAGLGWERDESVAKARAIISLDGTQKTGRTWFVLNDEDGAPDPIIIFNTDVGLEGVIEKSNKKKAIYPRDFTYTVPSGMTPDEVKGLFQPVWKRFVEEYEQALASDARTIVLDTASEFWEILRLAELGSQTVKMNRGQRGTIWSLINAKFRSLIRMAYSSDKTLVLLHQLKEEFKQNPSSGDDDEDDAGGAFTGKWVREGHKKIGHLVQVACLMSRQDSKFRLDITDCRQNADAMGMTLTGKNVNFRRLMGFVMPNVDPGEWD